MSTILDLRKKYYKKIDPLDFDLILEYVLKKPHSFILAHPEFNIPKSKIINLKSKISRRTKGEPLAYILGHKEFYGLDFIVNKNVLVPRPETELIVEEVIKKTRERKNKPARGGSASGRKTTFIDIGTGSGCIVISLAKLQDTKYKIPDTAYYGIDISAKALAVAKKNAKIHGLDKLIKFTKGNLLEPILKDKKLLSVNCELLIVANLPYLDTGWKNLLKSTETRGLKFEPSIALYSGQDGLDLYRELAGQIKMLRGKTKTPIKLFCEIGHLQAREMKKIFSFAKKVEIKEDHNCFLRLAVIEV